MSSKYALFQRLNNLEMVRTQLNIQPIAFKVSLQQTHKNSGEEDLKDKSPTSIVKSIHNAGIWQRGDILDLLL